MRTASPRTAILVAGNADGRDDVVLVHAGAFEVGVVLQAASGTGAEALSQVPTGAGVHPKALAVGDVDCDGCPDVVAANVGGLVVFRGMGCGG